MQSYNPRNHLQPTLSRALNRARFFVDARLSVCMVAEDLTEDVMDQDAVIDAILMRLVEIERGCEDAVTCDELEDLINTIKEEWK